MRCEILSQRGFWKKKGYKSFPFVFLYENLSKRSRLSNVFPLYSNVFPLYSNVFPLYSFQNFIQIDNINQPKNSLNYQGFLQMDLGYFRVCSL